MTLETPKDARVVALARGQANLFVEKGAEYRGQDFGIVAFDVRIERQGQSRQRLREAAAVTAGLRFTISA